MLGWVHSSWLCFETAANILQASSGNQPGWTSAATLAVIFDALCIHRCFTAYLDANQRLHVCMRAAGTGVPNEVAGECVFHAYPNENRIF